MQDSFEIILLQGGVLVKRVQGLDPYQVQEKTAGFIRRKYGEDPGNRS
jgi:hypothetical protein